jgi:hypothetical protein
MVKISLCTSWLVLLLQLVTVAAVENVNPNYAEILDQCEHTSTSVEDCQEIIFSSVDETKVKVVVVHQRTLEDEYYNQVVIPVDFQGLVLGNPPAFNSMVYYPFEWRGDSTTLSSESSNSELGTTRPVGPFNCTDMNDVQCCDSILAAVPDKDIMGNFIDCWLEESFRKTTEGQLLEVYRNPVDHSIHEMDLVRLARVEEREETERLDLVTEIHAFGATVHRSTFAQLASRVRHALRGYPKAQGLHYVLKMQLRRVAGGTDEYIQIANNTELQHVLPLIVSSLLHLGLEGGLHRFGGVTEGVNRDVIVLQTVAGLQGEPDHLVGDTAFLDLTEHEE